MQLKVNRYRVNLTHKMTEKYFIKIHKLLILLTPALR